MTSSSPGEVQYTVVHDDTYLGVEFFAEPGRAYPDLGDFRRTGMGPVGNSFGSVRLYRRDAAEGSEDMVVMWTQTDRRLIDAIRLSGDASDVRLVLSCEAKAALLVPTRLATEAGTFVGDLDDVIRAWRPGASGTLEEFDIEILAGLDDCRDLTMTERLPDMRASSDDPSYTVETAWEYLGFAGTHDRDDSWENLFGPGWNGSSSGGVVDDDRMVVVFHRDGHVGHDDLAVVLGFDDRDVWVTDALVLVGAPDDAHFVWACDERVLAVLGGVDGHLCCPSAAGALHVWTVGDEGHFVGGSPDDAVVEILQPTQLTAGTRYSTDADRTPILRFEPDRFGWTASDSMACGSGLGTLRLHHRLGWVYVVPTDGLTVDEAVGRLLEQSIVDPEVTDARLEGLGDGRRITGVLEQDIEFPLGELLPYHHVVEDGLPRPIMLGERIEIDVVASDQGIVTVVLAPEDGLLDELRDVAMPLLDTLELVGGSWGSASCPI